MTTPTGSPAWERTNDYATYGGHVEKINYQSQGVVNGRTDVDAAEFQRMAEDIAAVMRTADFSVVRYLNNDTATDPPTIQYVRQMNGVNAVGYEGDAAPSGMPSAERNGNGDVTFTWAASYTDAYGVSGTVNITDAFATVQTASGSYVAPCEIVSAVAVRVRVLDSTDGTAGTDQVVKLTVGTGPA